MTSVDLARVRRLVELVHDLEPERRAECLSRECGDDHALRAEVEELLDAADRAQDFLAPPESAPRVEKLMPVASIDAGAAIEGFRLVRRVASGGMGTVWEAEQAAPRRRVALKTLRSTDLSREAARRFRHEAEILARLRHPHVAQVFASGVHTLPSGEALPWYAMEFVDDARTLTHYARERELDLAARLALFATLCSAVQHGHERGVIHRDLKPSNVLVDGAGRLKVIDFGVARVRDPGGAFASFETETGRVLGTLQYMSPEQIAGASDGIDTRSDVYALGVLLYELVTGFLPHDFSRASLAEAARILDEETPVRPSVREKRVDADLEAIVLQALSKDRRRRYASAAELAQDVERYLRREPIAARPPSLGYQARLFARRHRLVVVSLFAIVATLVLAAPVALWLAWRATRAEDDALSAQHEALRQRDDARFRAYRAETAAAYAALRGLDASAARQHLERCPEDLRGFEWWLLARRVDRSSWTRTVDGNAASAVVWRADGRSLIVGADHAALEVRDAATGELLEHTDSTTTILQTLALDRAGERLLEVLRDGRIVVRDVETLAELASWSAHEPSATAGVFDVTGTRVFSAGWRGDAAEWDALTGARIRELESASGSISSLAASGDGRWLAGGTNTSAEIRVWDLATGQFAHRLRGHAGYVSSVAFDATSTLIASASHDHTLRLWDVCTGETRRVLRGHDNIVMRVAFDASNERLASCGWDRSVRLWSVADGSELARWVGCEANINSLAFSPDGAQLATVDAAAKVKLWDLAALSSDVVTVEGKWQWTLRYWPDSGSALAIRSGRAERIEARSARVLASFSASGSGWGGGDVSPDGSEVVLGDGAGSLCVWSADGRERRLDVRVHERLLFALDWSADGERIAVGADDGVVFTVDAVDGSRLCDFPNAGAVARALQFEPHGRRLAVGGGRGEVLVYDDEGQLLAASAPRFARSLALAWSPDAERIALAMDDGRVVIVDAATGALVHELLGHSQAAFGVAFAPDGSRLATCSHDRSVRLWEAATGREVAVLVDHAYDVDAIDFAPDGSALVTGSPDKTLRWWIAGDEAEREVERLRRKLFLARDVQGALAQDTRLDAAQRDEAMSLAQAETELDDPRELARAAWLVAHQPASEPAQLERAAAMSRTALAHVPADVRAHAALAAALLRLGQVDEALSAIALALALDAEHPSCRAVRVLILARAGRAQEAAGELTELETALESGELRSEIGLRSLIDEARTALGR